MSRMSLIALTALGLLVATGCTAANRIVGNNLTEVGSWYGELGITGHYNKITVQSQSRLTKLSIIGEGNRVDVKDHATLGKIEIWGANNTVTIPAYLVVRVNQVGHGTRVVRRSAEEAPPETPPAELMPPSPAAEPAAKPAEEPAAKPTEEQPSAEQGEALE